MRRVRWPGRQGRAGSPPAGRGWCGAGGRPWWRRTAGDRHAAQRLRQQRVGAGTKAAQHAFHGVLQVEQRGRPRVDLRQRIDQHDLPVEAGEVVAKERLHDVRFVAVEAGRAGRHGGERAAGGARTAGWRERKEGQQRRAGEVARQQEASRSWRLKQRIGRARRLQIAREELGADQRLLFVGGRGGIERRQKRQPFACGVDAMRRLCLGECACRPLGKSNSNNGRSSSHSPG